MKYLKTYIFLSAFISFGDKSVVAAFTQPPQDPFEPALALLLALARKVTKGFRFCQTANHRVLFSICFCRDSFDFERRNSLTADGCSEQIAHPVNCAACEKGEEDGIHLSTIWEFEIVLEGYKGYGSMVVLQQAAESPVLSWQRTLTRLVSPP